MRPFVLWFSSLRKVVLLTTLYTWWIVIFWFQFTMILQLDLFSIHVQTFVKYLKSHFKNCLKEEETSQCEKQVLIILELKLKVHCLRLYLFFHLSTQTLWFLEFISSFSLLTVGKQLGNKRDEVSFRNKEFTNSAKIFNSWNLLFLFFSDCRNRFSLTFPNKIREKETLTTKWSPQINLEVFFSPAAAYLQNYRWQRPRKYREGNATRVLH